MKKITALLIPGIAACLLGANAAEPSDTNSTGDTLWPSSREDREMYRFILGKIDKTDTDARGFIERYLSSDFGLYAYKTNFFLPYALADSAYPRWSESGIVATDPVHDKRYETEFQISFKKPLSFDLMGLNEAIVFAYTQKVWWQLYSSSAPFRETNYEPEIFISFPTPGSLDESTGLKGVTLGYVHESNGRGGLQSRSWNRIYLGGVWQHGNLFTSARVWYRLPEEAKTSQYDSNGDDNPDISAYLGYGDLNFSYLYGRHQLNLMLRNNLRFHSDNRGAAMCTWSYPMAYTEYSFWYLKLFSGYGESLIDYNRYVNKIAFGLSFSRGLF